MRTVEETIAPDGGQLYAETNLNAFIVEPWNALSAFLFLLMATYWWIKLKGRYDRHTFLTTAIVLLTIGGIGGTVYHALRFSAFFLYMDWLPILIICLMTSIYFLEKIIGNWYLALTIVGTAFLLQGFLYRYVDRHNAVNLNYGIMGTMVLLPTLLILLKHQFYQWYWVTSALFFFSLALFFRIADRWNLLPMGTHFLWHTFGALAGNFMFLFIYRLNKKEYKGVH